MNFSTSKRLDKSGTLVYIYFPWFSSTDRHSARVRRRLEKRVDLSGFRERSKGCYER
jgi:hypothetical protein